MNYFSSNNLASIKYLNSIGFSLINALNSGVFLIYNNPSWYNDIVFPFILNESAVLTQILNLIDYSMIGCLDSNSLITNSFH